MEEVETGAPVTAEQAIRIVESSGFPPSKPIAFPDGIVAPADRPDGGFFDPERTDHVADIELQRRQRHVDHDDGGGPLGRVIWWMKRAVTGEVREEFALAKRIAYVDDHVGVVIVPAFLGPFRTDLTSVPRFFTWLVPKTGLHLPAAILHDGLVHDEDEPQTYIAGEPIDREEADRIFRDAMRELGTPLLRRWLIWTTVMLATLTTSRDRARWIPTIVGSVALVLALGVLATLDLVDARAPLPWMGERPWLAELALGLVAAVVVSALVGLAWGRRWIVGFISSMAVALLFHVTALIATVYAGIGVLEGLADRDVPKVVTYLAALVVLGASLALVIALA